MAEQKAPIARKGKSDILNSFYTKYGLNKDSDIHEQKNKATGRVMFRIITRSGIEKIQTKAGISVVYDLLPPSDVPTNWVPIVFQGKVVSVQPQMQVVIKAIGKIADENGNVKTMQTFGEASSDNVRQGYPFAIAEKRALSRVVLKLAGMYEYGFFGEDEADDFKDTMNAKRKAGIKIEIEEPSENEIKNG